MTQASVTLVLSPEGNLLVQIPNPEGTAPYHLAVAGGEKGIFQLKRLLLAQAALGKGHIGTASAPTQGMLNDFGDSRWDHIRKVLRTQDRELLGEQRKRETAAATALSLEDLDL